jgi:hypothetical protein
MLYVYNIMSDMYIPTTSVWKGIVDAVVDGDYAQNLTKDFECNGDLSTVVLDCPRNPQTRLAQTSVILPLPDLPATLVSKDKE